MCELKIYRVYTWQLGGYEGGDPGRVKQRKEIRRYRLPVTQYMSHMDKTGSMGNITSSTGISLYGGRW